MSKANKVYQYELRVYYISYIDLLFRDFFIECETKLTEQEAEAMMRKIPQFHRIKYVELKEVDECSFELGKTLFDNLYN